MSEPIVVVWSYMDYTYGPGLTRVPCERREDWPFSGRSPGDELLVVDELVDRGHVILTDSRYDRPWNHRVAGVGVGHDDARFAETGSSHAAYLENGEAFGGRWWETTSSSTRRAYGLGS